MRLKDQVCTLPQAVRLSELGITQNSTFHHVYVYVNEDIDWQIWMEGSFDEYNGEIQMYCAFTVAELGQMLPTDPTMLGRYSYYHRYNCKGHSVGYSEIAGSNHIEVEWFQTEAEARSALLIKIIEEGTITIEEINKRLLK